MLDLYPVAWPFLRLMDPETAHKLAVQMLARGVVPGDRGPDDPVLATGVWGLRFPNPVGLAAGFDKDAEAVDPLLRLGFGFVEAGTVTPRPQPGNPKPRLFRLTEDEAVINRFGFNNAGLEAFTDRLKRRRGNPGIVGANVGKNKDTPAEDAALDYVKGVKACAPVASYLVVNVSSPNTPGLRALQGRAELADLLAKVKAALPGEAPPPLLLKIAPDLTDADKADIAHVVEEVGVDGLIVSNTTIDRPESLRDPQKAEIGGLSGKPLFALSTRVLAEMYELTAGRVPLVGVGGVSTGADAYAKIRAGASLVQVYSAMVYKGPALVRRIKDDLAARLKADGFAHVAEAVGADHA